MCKAYSGYWALDRMFTLWAMGIGAPKSEIAS
jgi:hypothetical protein